MPKSKLLFTGPTGSSKSTIAKLIAKYLADMPKPGTNPKVLARDTSFLLDISRNRRTKAGLLLLALNSEQKDGFVLDAGPVIASLEENFAWLAGLTNLEVLLLAGSPRTEEEAAYLKRMLYARFILVEATDQQVIDSVQSRIDSGEMREDDGPRTVKRKLLEYNEKIIPAANSLPEDRLLRINRTMPLLQRVELSVQHMYVEDDRYTVIPKKIHDRWMDKLRTRSHPIHAAIKEIEEPRRSDAPRPTAHVHQHHSHPPTQMVAATA